MAIADPNTPVSRLSSAFVSAIVTPGPTDERVAERVAELWRILRDRYENFELLCVLDGGHEQVGSLKPLLSQLDCVRLLCLSRRFGRDAALAAGLESAIGDIVVTLDLATDPLSLVPEAIERCRKGAGAVVGVDPERTGQGTFERLGAGLFYRLAHSLFDLESIANATSLLALSRPALGALLRIKEQSRHPQVFLPYIGFGVETLSYQPSGRTAPPRGLFGSIARAIELLVTGSMRPLRLVSWLSLGASCLNGVYILYVVAIALFKQEVAKGWPTMSLLQGVMFFLLFLVLAVLSEYVGRILEESRRRPQYVLRDELSSSVVVEQEQRRNIVRDSE
jgi:hypothetical protein